MKVITVLISLALLCSTASAKQNLPQCAELSPMDCMIEALLYMDSQVNLLKEENARLAEHLGSLEAQFNGQQNQLKIIAQDTHKGRQDLLKKIPQLSSSNVYRVARARVAGETDKELTESANSSCFLTKVAVEETDSDKETVACEIIQKGKHWVLRTMVESNNDQNVQCEARCLSW